MSSVLSSFFFSTFPPKFVARLGHHIVLATGGSLAQW